MRKNVLEITALSTGISGVPVGSPTIGSVPVAAATTVRVVGSASLSGAYNISPTGTPVTNTFIELYWEASLSNGASHAVVVFGKTVPAELITSVSKFKVECLYNGTAWNVNILPDDAGTGIVGTARIADDAVTLDKMASGTTGSILAYNASGDIEEVDMATDGKLLIGVTAGKGYNAAVLSGDATLSTGGVLSLANNSVDTAELVDASVTTAKIDDAAVTAAKLDASSRKASIAIPVSFETAGEIGVLKYTMCFDCTVDAIHATVTKPAATDTATAIFKDHGGVVLTGSQVDITTGLVLGNIVTTTPTANNTFLAGEQITIETSKTTAGSGNFTAILCLTHD
jgi:hypothetical protein